MIGSSAVFINHFPKHLEDMFTLIHQNLLSVLSSNSNALFDELALQQSLLPDLLKDMLKNLETALGKKIQKLGLEINNVGATFKYNIPLRDHSAQVSLHFDKRSNEIYFNAFLFGNNENSRWIINGMILKTLDKMDILPLTEAVHSSEKEMRFSWKIQDLSTCSIAIKEWKALMDNSFALSDGSLAPTPVLKDFLSRYKASNGLKILYNMLLKEEMFQSIAEIYEILPPQNKVEIDNIILMRIKEIIRDFTPLSKSKSKNLLISLLEFDKGWNEAIVFANAGMIHVDRDIRLKMFDLFEVLIKINGKSYEGLEKGAKIGITDEDREVRQRAIGLFESLAKKDIIYYKVAEKAASIGIKDVDLKVRQKALHLFESLTIRNLGFDAAIKAANLGITDENSKIRQEALRLFEFIIHKNKGYSEAAIAASLGMTDADSNVRKMALNIQTILSKKK
ncbi:MAG: hypothetical protein H0X29_11120 [Parachlamydiaceae bacterium]|nr:hypothetical protein [Parachlamydiaceae bacterium]